MISSVPETAASSSQEEVIQIFPLEGWVPLLKIERNSNWFLRLLIEKLGLPTFCLVDCDPYGFDILTTYKFGSMQMAYDAKYLRIPEMYWLGVFTSDFEKYDIPPRCLLPLTVDDKRKTKAMLSRCYLQRESPHWRSELELMLQRGVKFEIEALSVCSLSFLSEEYIPSKIQELCSESKYSLREM